MVNRIFTPHNENLSELRFGVKEKYRHSDSIYPHSGRMKEVGKRIKELRTARELTQPQLAEALKAGQSTLSELENGLSKHPSALLLVKLARYFDVDIEWLLTGKGPQQSVSSMSDEEAELLILFRGLSQSGQQYILGRAREVHQDEQRNRPSPPRRPDEPGAQGKTKTYQ